MRLLLMPIPRTRQVLLTFAMACALAGYAGELVRAGQAGPGSDAPEPFLAEVARLNRAVAPVVCRSGVTEKPVDRILGTAFFVSATGEFVTADHVIAAGTRDCRKAVYLPVNGWSPDPDSEIRLYNFTRCVRDWNADIAVCRTDLDLSESANIGIEVKPIAFNTSESQDGTPIAFTGFPLEIRYPLTARGYLAASQPAFIAGGLPRLVLDRIAWPGSSGSPVYGADGRVMGMVIERGIERSTGLSFARPASLIVEAVTKFRQQHPPPAPKQPAVENAQPVEKQPPPENPQPTETPQPVGNPPLSNSHRQASRLYRDPQPDCPNSMSKNSGSCASQTSHVWPPGTSRSSC